MTTSSSPAPLVPLDDYLQTGWAESTVGSAQLPVAAEAARRRERLTSLFPNELLVFPAGEHKVRNNDMRYRFRPDTAHTYFSGNQESDAVLVMSDEGSTLFIRPRSTRDPDDFFRDIHYGELWVGRRPTVEETAERLSLDVRPLADLATRLESGRPVRVNRGVSPIVDALVPPDDGRDAELARIASEHRRIKDPWELARLRDACRMTAHGYEDVAQEWDRVQQFGERWIEGTFFRRARAMGNDIGYDTVAASGSHAAILHWWHNTGAVAPGELVLIDMGVEERSLYTADICRTLPASGRYSPLQRELYDLVLAAQQAAIEAVRPGVPFRTMTDAAAIVFAHGLDDLGILPCSAEESLDPGNLHHTRWTIHGTSHMLGMDVHDCGLAGAEHYRDGMLEEGMVFTVEPGLYFQQDDLLVPEEFRGIGIRIEDDILVTADGHEHLSPHLPRAAEDVEKWMGELRG
ncbi:aminopeptidase P family protein [Microbacterium tumbae]